MSTSSLVIGTVSATLSVAPGSTTVTTEVSPIITAVTPVVSVNIGLTQTQTTLTALTTKSTRTTQYINVGPLTQTFTHPAKCATLLGHEWLLDPPELAAWHPTCRTAEDADCYPPRTTLKPTKVVSTIKTVDPQVTYYSPGIQCPEGWTTAYTSAGGKSLPPIPTPSPVQLNEIPQPLLDPDQTLAICCPSSFDVGGLYCTSTTAVSSVSNLCQIAASTGLDGYVTVAGPVTTALASNVATATHPAIKVQHPIVLVYKQTDLTVHSSGGHKPTQTASPNRGSVGAAPRLGAVVAVALAAASCLLGLTS